MDPKQRIEMARQHVEMLDSKSFNDPRALPMRALISHYRHGKPTIQTVLTVARECGVAGFEMFKGLEHTR